jgi:hypothetical protein
MTIALFLTSANSRSNAAQKHQRCVEDLIPQLRLNNEISAASLFLPGETSDPYVDDGAPPDLILQIDLPSMEALDRLGVDTIFKDNIECSLGGSVNYEAFEVLNYNVVPGEIAPPRTAPVSYNVRYLPPIEDVNTFVDFYVENHVPILKELPGIRNVICYLPIAWNQPTDWECSDCILGNETVFDSIDCLNAALASDVRHKLRDDYNAFPIKPGPNTHYAMIREDFS